jgi:hypothetical protein
VRMTRTCAVLWAVTIVMWVVATGAAVAVAYPGWEHPWWLVLLRGPVFSAGAAGMTVGLTMWHLVAALPHLYSSGVAEGVRMCERTHRDAQVIPMQGRNRAEDVLALDGG